MCPGCGQGGVRANATEAESQQGVRSQENTCGCTQLGIRGWAYAAGANVTGADAQLGGRDQLGVAGADTSAYGVIR